MWQIFKWFIYHRWYFVAWVSEYSSTGYSPGNRFEKLLSPLYNNNVFGCRKHPVIYNDMCRIVGGGKCP